MTVSDPSSSARISAPRRAAPDAAICVYCGSSGRVPQLYKDSAARLGQALAEAGIGLVYGGGRVGLMGILADAALAAGGHVTGVIPEHIREQEVDHQGLDELIVVDSMHTRKRIMAERSRGFIVLPGGLGTLDETFEILTWKQLSLHDRPVLLVNIAGYWDPLVALIDAQAETGFVRPQHRRLFQLVDTVEAAIARLPDLIAHPGPMVGFRT